jgi:hypothetical protein
MKQLKKFNPRVLWIFVLLTIANVAFGQMDQYSRKSISFVNMLVYSGGGEKFDFEIEQAFLSRLQSHIQLDRFDVNQLPTELGNKLRNAIPNSQDIESSDILVSAMESVILPELQKILDVEKEIRARDFVSETERNSFISLKAKEFGVNSEHMIDVMNSAYIFLPYASSIKAKKHHKDDDDEDDKDKMNVTVNGGLYIYKVNYTGDYSITKMGEVSSSAYASESKGKGSWNSAKNSAFIESASSLGQSLKLELQKIEDFKLKAQLRKVKGLHVKFPLGKKEGLKLDRPYYVGEWVENKKGVRRFKKDGFVRIGKVANNYNDPSALSTGYIIHKGDWARGMTLVEHPTLGIDFAFKPRMFKLKVDSGYIKAEEKHPALYIASADKDLFGMDFDLNINIAEQTKKLQSFLVLGGSVSALTLENRVFNKDDFPIRYIEDNMEKSATIFYNGHIGYLRKNYVGPIAFHREFLLGFQGISFSNEYVEGDDDLNINAFGFGGSVTLGLEVALNIDWNLGVFGGYDFYPGLPIWTMSYADKDDEDDDKDIEIEEFNGFDFPKIKNVGPTFGIYLHYSLPSLGGGKSKMVDMVSENLMNQMF